MAKSNKKYQFRKKQISQTVIKSREFDITYQVRNVIYYKKQGQCPCFKIYLITEIVVEKTFSLPFLIITK